MISLKLLSALNAGDDDLINKVCTAIEDGHVGVTSDLDTVTSLHLTPEGRRAWPMTLPTATA